MKKTILAALLVLFASAPALAGIDEDFGAKPKGRSLYVVETDEKDLSESLNRIAGDIDMGFSAPEPESESENHYSPGAMGRSRAMENRDNGFNSY